MTRYSKDLLTPTQIKSGSRAVETPRSTRAQTTVHCMFYQGTVQSLHCP
uniref:Uncharacterized protein n=1 Tax=Anguilla anguilla TaxID=7936 RepID=A0A0E9WZN2_ANGAN